VEVCELTKAKMTRFNGMLRGRSGSSFCVYGVRVRDSGLERGEMRIGEAWHNSGASKEGLRCWQIVGEWERAWLWVPNERGGGCCRWGMIGGPCC